MELGSPAGMVRNVRFPVHELPHIFKNAGVRTGIYAGIGLAIAFSTWLYVANRVPSLEASAPQRNFVAAALLGMVAALPVVRFFRSPGDLLVSSLVAWSILTVTYRVLCMQFSALGERLSTSQIFTLGAIIYMILATVSWIGTCIWRVRASGISHPNHHI